MAESAKRYDLIEPIASGGMGEVFRAEVRGEHGFVRPVAVKRIRPELARTPELLLRFIVEAKTTVRLIHANVVQVLDLCRAGEDLYIVMELVDGIDLGFLFRELAQRRESLPVPMVLYLAAETLKALAYAHERGGVGRGIVHCDISPSNLLVSCAGEVKVTDFGIAQSLRRSARGSAVVGQVMGKLRYMAPEQTRGELLDERTDLYSLGVVLYEALTLRPLFLDATRDDEQIIEAVLNEVPPSLRHERPDVPLALSELLDAALAKSPADRPRRARDMLQAVTRIAHEVDTLVTAPEVGQWVTRMVRLRERAAPAVGAPGDVSEPAVDTAPSFEAAPRGTESVPIALARPRTLTYTGHRGPDGLLVLSDGAARAPVVQRGRAPWIAAGLVVSVAAAAYGAARVVTRDGETALSPIASPSPVASPSAATATFTSPSPPTTPTPSPARARGGRAHEIGVGVLNVYAEPWAEATLDGRAIGTTPIVGFRVAAGEHVLRLRNPRSRPYEKRLRIHAGGKELVSVELEPTR